MGDRQSSKNWVSNACLIFVKQSILMFKKQKYSKLLETNVDIKLHTF